MDDVDQLIKLGSERPPQIEACLLPDDFDAALLIAYRRRALRGADVEEVERHLVACAHCRDIASAIDAPAPSRWRPAIGALLVAAAAVLFTVVIPAGRPSPYAIVEVRGQLAEQRGETGRNMTFDGESPVAIKVEPQGDRPAGTLQVFRGDTRLKASVEPGEGGVFWIRGDGADLFGQKAGKKTLTLRDEGGHVVARFEATYLGL